MSIFDEVEKIFTGRDFDINNPYMMNRMLSFVPTTFVLSSMINRYLSQLPDWALKAIYKNCIEHRRAAPYIAYAKKPKTTEDKLVQKMTTYLCCNNMHARHTIVMLRMCGHKPEQYFGLKKGE